MCGILFHLSCQPVALPATDNSPLLALISNRGPNSCSTYTVAHTSSAPPFAVHHLQFTSTVLALRGDHIIPQPLICPSTGSVLCWNGEAWHISGDEVPAGRNDAEQLFRSLVDATRQGTGDITIVINSISGPFAFIFYDKQNGRVWFGRDCLGRRSLLSHYATLKRDGYDGLTIASVTDGLRGKGWEEVEADGVYHIELGQEQIVPNWVPFLKQGNEVDGGLHLTFPYPPLNLEKPPGSPPLLTRESQTIYELRELLQDAVRLRVQNIFTPGQPQQESTCKLKQSRVAILFSGGLDCTVLARLVHEVLPHEESIDLLNVAFENPRVVEARSNGPTPSKNKKLVKGLNSMAGTIDVDGGIYSTKKQHIPTAVEASTTIDPYSLCPDRLTCLSSLQDLKASCPTRKFNLVFINVPLRETLAHRQTVISLMYPHNTEMDLSIALAFYFSARGLGVLHSSGNLLEESPLPYSTASRILLSGLGADELFAGYARHETAFRRGGYEALLAELELDIGRLGKRNLGRDDRVISHWGKEGRYPYLDERVVRWAMEQPVWKKCDFEKCKRGESGIEGGKKVLRLVAQVLGMEGVAIEKKRAIQFGAKTAKMEVYPGGGRVKGTRVVN